MHKLLYSLRCQIRRWICLKLCLYLLASFHSSASTCTKWAFAWDCSQPLPVHHLSREPKLKSCFLSLATFMGYKKSRTGSELKSKLKKNTHRTSAMISNPLSNLRWNPKGEARLDIAEISSNRTTVSSPNCLPVRENHNVKAIHFSLSAKIIESLLSLKIQCNS